MSNPSTDAHPLIASSVFHYEFEFIHPFSDGNGRMERLEMTIPDKPNSRLQKYRLIDKGSQWLAQYRDLFEGGEDGKKTEKK